MYVGGGGGDGGVVGEGVVGGGRGDRRETIQIQEGSCVVKLKHMFERQAFIFTMYEFISRSLPLNIPNPGTGIRMPARPGPSLPV